MTNPYIKILKTNHYIKNFVVFIPLLFSFNYASIKQDFYAFIAFAAFCLLASGIYVFNDIIDVESDRQHPIKCQRPIASGEISIKLAVLYSIFLFVLSCSLSILFLDFKVSLILLSYMVLNVLYSLKLKFYSIIDVFCIAFGFILRILAGCAAINVKPSPLVILLTFFTSMFFTFSKRKLEFTLQVKEKRRKALQNYTVSLLDYFVVINAILSISFYFTYMLDQQTIQRVGNEFLYITVIPFTLIVFRLLFLINTTDKNDDPAIFIKDKTIIYTALAYLIVLLVIIFT